MLRWGAALGTDSTNEYGLYAPNDGVLMDGSVPVRRHWR
jgi:hypothetical protein